MTVPRRKLVRRAVGVVAVTSMTSGGCSGANDAPSSVAVSTIVARTTTAGTVGTSSTGSTAQNGAPAVAVGDGSSATVGPEESADGSAGAVTSSVVPPPDSTAVDVTTGAGESMDEADALVLFGDGSSGGEDVDGEMPTTPDGPWSDSMWQVDVPGAAATTVVDGIGLMETDTRGTHEWVRAVASETEHTDATVTARITPRGASQGTAFIGLHGDGEWRDVTPYLQQTGVMLEYGFAPVFEGELVLVVLDGPNATRFGPVPGPVLESGQTAVISIQIRDGIARAKAWAADADEPEAWAIEAPAESTGPGILQIAYRDAPAQTLQWDEIRVVVDLPG